MRLPVHLRNWHAWAGILVALPVLILVVTAVAMAHRKALGSDDIVVAANWLPGYGETAGKNADKSADKSAGIDARASLVAANGDLYLGTQSGLFQSIDGRVSAVEPLAGTPIRGLAEAPWGRVAAARSGVWLERDGNWERVHKGDAWSAAGRADGTVVVAVRDKGLLVSGDGRNWRPDGAMAALATALPAEAAVQPLTLTRLLLDLHTGKAWLGKEGEWLWIDGVALGLGLLAVTGSYLWWRKERNRRVRKLVAVTA